MGVFWKYFRETLRWPLVWTAGPIAMLVSGAASALDGVRDDILWLREQFSPATCDDAYLPLHAVARGIRQYTLETSTQFRARVVAAYQWWSWGGTVGGMPEQLAYFGFTAGEIINMRSVNPERWAEFTIELEKTDGSGFAETDFDLAEWLVNDQKPARSICAGINMVCSVSGNSPVVMAGLFIAPDVEVWPLEET